MEKRGQTTIYIILGIIIVAVVLLLVFFKDSIFGLEEEQAEQIVLPTEIQEVQNMVDDCMQDTVEKAIFVTSMQGGYLAPPLGSYRTEEGIIVAYGLQKGKNTLIEKNNFEQELAKYVEIFVEPCLSLDAFPNMKIITNDPESSAIIKDDLVNFETDYVVKIIFKEKEYKLNSKYNNEVPIRLGHVHKIANLVIDEVKSNPSDVTIANLVGLGFDIEAQPLEEGLIIWTITDEESKINEVPFSFIFMTKQGAEE